MTDRLIDLPGVDTGHSIPRAGNAYTRHDCGRHRETFDRITKIMAYISMMLAILAMAGASLAELASMEQATMLLWAILHINIYRVLVD